MNLGYILGIFDLRPSMYMRKLDLQAVRAKHPNPVPYSRQSAIRLLRQTIRLHPVPM